MASKKKRGGGNGNNVKDLTIEILKSIRDEIRSTNVGLETLRTDLTGRLDQTNARLDVHEQALVKLIGEVHTLNDRFDNFLTGAHGKEHDALRTRIENIEKRLDKVG